MIIFTIINVKKKQCFIIKRDYRSAIKLLQTIINSPHSQRFIRVPTYKCVNESYYVESLIDYLYSKQIPTHAELLEWSRYDIKIIK